MPSIRIIAGAAIGSLFVCGLFGGQGMAQTASTDPIGTLMQFLQPGKSEAKPPEKSAAKSEAKPPEKSAAKHSSKGHAAAKKRASTKPATKESTLNGARRWRHCRANLCSMVRPCG